MADPEVRSILLDRLPKKYLLEIGSWQIRLLDNTFFIRNEGAVVGSYNDLDVAVDRFLELSASRPGVVYSQSA